MKKSHANITYPIIYPWNAKKAFRDRERMLTSIYEHLERFGFDAEAYSEMEPTESLRSAVGTMMPELLKSKWILCFLNSVELLRTLSDVIPICFSLSTHDSSARITTDMLIRRYRDQEEGSRDSVKMARNTTLLVWMNPDLPHDSGDRYHSKFYDILLRRRSLEWPTLFMVPLQVKNFDSNMMGAAMSGIGFSLGRAASMLIREVSIVHHFSVALKPEEIISMKI